MERESRVKKPPQSYEIPKICFPRIRKKKPKKKVIRKSEYQIIPYPLKYTYTNRSFPLYGDVSLKERGGSLYTETGVMNQFLMFREVFVKKEDSYTQVSLSIEKRFQVQLPPWQHLVESLEQSESYELRTWARRIKEYSIQHENVYRSFSVNEVNINGVDEKNLLRTTGETNKRIHKLFQNYPCLMFVSSHSKDDSKLTEISFNEQYVEELGYSLETFASSILQEGLPQMMPTDTACAAKILIDHYYDLGRQGYETPEMISDLIMKNGFAKKVRFKICYMGGYRNNAYDLHAIVTILGKDVNIHKEPQDLDIQLNRRFLKKMISKEKEADKFVQKYYDTHINLPYTNLDKTCRVTDLDV